MTSEEIKAYVNKIESSSLENVSEVLPSPELYNIDVTMGKICDALAENVNILRRLNNESDKHELDDEILDLLKKYYICVHYLDDQSEYIHDRNTKGHRVVFAKTPAGKPYFNIDLAKVPRETYDEVKKTFECLLSGENMGNETQVKYYSDIKLPHKVLEFKGFQVRIYTTKLKGNVLCVFGLKIKKDDNPKSIRKFLEDRLTALRERIETLKKAMNDPVEKKELLLDSEIILNDIMDTLNKGVISDSDEVEMLFPSDEELQALVEYKEVSEPEEPAVKEAEEEPVEANEELIEVSKNNVPKTSKKVKKRTRGLGKKTIARNEITASLKGLSLEELMKIQNFITKLKMDKGLSDTIGNIYEGFLKMSDEQTQKFESSIKDFKHDNIGRSR